MTYQGDPNHPLGGPPHRYAQNERSRKMVWGTFAVLAILVLAGFMFYNSGGHGPQTASNNSPAVRSAGTYHNAGSSPDTQAVAKSAKDVATRVLVMAQVGTAPFSPERDGKRNRAAFIHSARRDMVTPRPRFAQCDQGEDSHGTEAGRT